MSTAAPRDHVATDHEGFRRDVPDAGRGLGAGADPGDAAERECEPGGVRPPPQRDDGAGEPVGAGREAPAWRPSRGATPGRSLCKLGFPLHRIVPVHDEKANTFTLPEGSVPLPLFPMEGMFRRVVNTRAPGSGDGEPSAFIETSTPSLVGQMGGPMRRRAVRCGAVGCGLTVMVVFDSEFAEYLVRAGAVCSVVWPHRKSSPAVRRRALTHGD